MSNKDAPGYPACDDLPGMWDRSDLSGGEADCAEELKALKAARHREDLNDFMKAAITGLCANPACGYTTWEFLAEDAAKIAEGALAEWEKRS